MAKGIYVGVSGKARKGKKMYFGVSGKARKVKKAYIGVGGKARLWFTSEGLAYHGTATTLATSRYDLSSASVGNYALFAGGQTASSTYSNVVSAYNGSLTRSLPTSLYDARTLVAGTSIGDYALFHGGRNASACSNRLHSYNASLTRSYKTASNSRHSEAATTIGDYALFAGGNTSTGTISSGTSAVIAVNASLTVSTATELSTTMTRPKATTVGNYALIGVTTVNAYNSSITRLVNNPTELPSTVSSGAAVTVGDYAMFCPSGYTYNEDAIIYVYNASLTQSKLTSGLDQIVTELAAISIGKYALFAGGSHWTTGTNTKYSTAVTVYDTSLTKTTGLNLSAGRHRLGAGRVGNYALFAGGYTGAKSNAVDVFVAS